MLYRAFPWSRGVGVRDAGGPLFVPRIDQGYGRHDDPSAYGVLYLSRSAESAAAEYLKDLRRHEVSPKDLEIDGTRLALATLDEEGLPARLLDLDDPRNLVARNLRPSGVATHDRDVTQVLAGGIFDDGHVGFEWWSTIEASWINVTLFAERALAAISLVGEPEVLTLDHPVVRAAARIVGVRLAA